MGSSPNARTSLLPLPHMIQREASGAQVQWPLINEDPKALSDWWRGRTYSQQLPPVPKPRSARPVAQRLAQAVVRGAILGLDAVGLLFGVAPAIPWWLADWRWAFALAALLVASLLFRPKRALAVALLAALIQAIPAFRTELKLVGMAVAIVIGARILWEFIRIAFRRS